MKSILYLTISLLCMVQAVYSQCPAITPLSIGEIVTKESRCKANGSATIRVKGGVAPYTYSITAGPFLPPVQSTNTFLSLSAGTYTVKVSDQCNKSASKIFTITGSYEVPVITSTLVHPKCQDSTGSIAIEINNDGARAPFRYSLVAPSPKIVTSQVSNVFKNLPTGTYTYRVTDSCGNYQSRTSTLISQNDNIVSIEMKDLILLSCDSFALPYVLGVKNTSLPYRVNFVTGKGTQSRVLRPSSAATLDTFYFKYRHATGNLDLYSINTQDECGRLVSMPKNMLNMDMEAVSFSKQDCSQDLVYSFDYQKDNAPYRCKPTYYTLVGPNGNILAKQTNNSSFTGYAPGKGYKIIREDCCRKDSLLFEWSQQLPLSIVYSKIAKQSSCKEGTTDINIRTNYPFIGDLIIASGPPSVTFRDGTVHPYVYPDTIKKVAFNATSFVSINYFTEGTYQLYVVDNCGRKAGTTVTILPSDLRRTTLVSAYEQGCENSHSIKWQVKSNFYGGEVTIQQVPEYQKKINTLEAVDSVMNLRSGAYMVNYKYTAVSPVDVYLRNMRSVACDVIVDTLDIPAYLQPAFKAPVITVCGKNLTVTLLPDSSRGIWPYQYQITSTPNSTPLQKSNVFPNLSKGTYTFLMSDACGNSYSQNTSVDTLVFPSLNVSGKTCAGQSVTLAAALYPFYSYKWVRPNGKTSSGHALTINPLTAADTGMYKVTVTPNIFGCTQSKSQQVRVNFCKVLPISFINFDANFNGTVVLLQWQVAYDEEAKYYIIEKSTDGRSFRSLSRIEASGLGTYEGTDFSYEQGLNYYRIKVVHHDGTEDHSRTVAVHTDGEELLTLSPNPADAAVYVKWASSILGGKLEILDVSGKVLIQHTVDPEVGQTVIDVEALAPGMYLLKFDQNGEVQFKKFMKQ